MPCEEGYPASCKKMKIKESPSCREWYLIKGRVNHIAKSTRGEGSSFGEWGRVGQSTW